MGCGTRIRRLRTYHPLRLNGGGKFDENHVVTDLIQRNSKKSASMPPTVFENLVASTLFTAQVQRDELRMLKYLHIVSARFLSTLELIRSRYNDKSFRVFFLSLIHI